MKQLVTTQQMKDLERVTFEDYCVPDYLLMEQAACAIAEYLYAAFPDKKITFVCGTGNNGGDGLAAARILKFKKCNVNFILAGDRSKESELARTHRLIAEKCGIASITQDELINSDVIVDSLFGIGLNRGIDGAQLELINKINQLEKFVLAVDIPSGINADTGRIMGCAVKANKTITFGYVKPGLLLYPGAEYAGNITVKDISLAVRPEADKRKGDSYFTYEQDDLKTLVPKRKNDSHKGAYGKILLIAGFQEMTGAAYLSAKAAYRTGAGMVRVITSASGMSVLQKLLPEALVSKYLDEAQAQTEKETMNDLPESYRNWCDVVVIGPGLGKSEAAQNALEHILTWKDKKMILDADALNLLAEMATDRGCRTIMERISFLSEKLPKEVILTPHLQELARLLSIDIKECKGSLIPLLEDCCSHTELIWAAKDARTITAYRDKRCINNSGNHGMATAGSGDVLTGIIAGLLSMGADSFTAASLGVYIHGLAGDVAAKRKGTYALLSGDIAESIADVLRPLDQEIAAGR